MVHGRVTVTLQYCGLLLLFTFCFILSKIKNVKNSLFASMLVAISKIGKDSQMIDLLLNGL